MDILNSILIFFMGWFAGKALDKTSSVIYVRVRNWFLRKTQKFVDVKFNSLESSVVILHSWSYSHRLYPVNTKIKIVERPKTLYIRNELEFNEFVKEYKAQNIRGEVCYMVDYNIDHMDNEYGKNFELYVAPSDYSEASSVSKYLENHQEIKSEILDIIQQNPKLYFRQAIPSDIFLNMIVISENNKLLALKRSRAVSSAQGLWGIGAYETMELPYTSTACNDVNFHKLAERCLFEEIGISPCELSAENGKIRHFFDTDSIFISSISLSLHHMGTLVTAIVKLKNITEEELCEKIVSTAHSKYEHDGIEWMEFNKKEIKKFIETNSGLYADFVKNNNSRWISYVKLSLYEVYRVGDFDKYSYR